MISLVKLVIWCWKNRMRSYDSEALLVIKWVYGQELKTAFSVKTGSNDVITTRWQCSYSAYFGYNFYKGRMRCITHLFSCQLSETVWRLCLWSVVYFCFLDLSASPLGPCCCMVKDICYICHTWLVQGSYRNAVPEFGQVLIFSFEWIKICIPKYASGSHT